jgi:5'-3' exonuclease
MIQSIEFGGSPIPSVSAVARLKEPIIFTDGDILAYRAAAATDGRQYIVRYDFEGTEITTYEKYKKDADKIVKANPGATLELVYEPEPEETALKVLKQSCVSLETNLKVHCDGIGPVFMYTSNKGSFREKVYTGYKANRVGMRKPAHLMACKEWLLTNYFGECRAGELEADDLMAIYSTEATEKGVSSLVASIDKDLKQIPGYHFDFVKNKLIFVSEEEAHRNLYTQMLTGDATDGIPGIKGVGPKTAEKLLKGVMTPYLMYCVVLKEYLRATPQQAGESFEDFTIRVVATVRVHAQLLYLLRHEEEYWNAPLA